MKTWVKIFDIIIILLVAIVTFFIAFRVYMNPQKQAQVLVRGQSREWTYPVGTEETITVPGPIGNTTVRLHGNRAWIETSPCDNQTCVAAGSVSRQGQWTACLPNNVLLMIHGAEDDDVDSFVW